MADMKFQLSAIDNIRFSKFKAEYKPKKYGFDNSIFKKNPQESLLKLKQKLEERISKIQEGESPDQIKQELIKNLKSQIKLLDLRMKEQRRQKMKEEEKINKRACEQKMKKAKSDEKIDSIQMEEMVQNIDQYRKVAKKMSTGNNMKSRAKIYKSEANI